MRLAVLSTNPGGVWPWGASEELWAAAAAAALAEGHQVGVWVAATAAAAAAVRDLAARGAEVHARRPRHMRLSNWIARVPAPDPRWASLFNFRPDVLLLSQGATFDAGSYPEFLTLLRRLDSAPFPFGVVSHGGAELSLPSGDVRDRTRRLFAAARFTAFVSARSAALVERQLTMKLGNAVVVRNPLRFRPEEPLSWPSESPARFAVPTRLDAGVKGLDTLLETLSADVWRERDWRLTLCGEGPDGSYLAELAAFYGIAGKVAVEGRRDDVLDIWRAHHLFLLPSRTEAMPTSLVEAMICGRASVVADVGGVLELVVDGESAFVAEGATVRSFGAALERAWSQRTRWREMGACAHARAWALVDPRAGESLLKLLKGIAAGR